MTPRLIDMWAKHMAGIELGAALISDVLSVIAIVIALVAIRGDANRAAADTQRLERERLLRFGRFVADAASIIGQATDSLSRRESTLAASSNAMAALTPGFASLSQELAPIAMVVEGLRQAVPADAVLAIELSRISLLLDELVRNQTAMMSTSTEAAGQWVKSYRERIDTATQAMRSRAFNVGAPMVTAALGDS